MKPLTLTALFITNRIEMEVPALIARIPAGAAVDIGDDLEFVNIGDLLTQNNPNALMLKVEGESMTPEVKDGSYIILDRAKQPELGDLVVASINGAYTFKRLKGNDIRGRQGLFLVASNSNFTTRELKPGQDFRILGTVVWIVNPS